MNKLIAITVLAGGLLIAAAPSRAAHDVPRYERPAAAYHHWRFSHRDHRYRGSRHRAEYRRGHDYYNHARRGHMPRWLRLQGSFRHWYRHSQRRHDRHLSWHQLHNIYYWERSRHRRHRY